MIDRRRFLAGVATLPFASSACGDTAETNLPPPPAVAELKLVAQSWGTSQVTSKIAELLIREQLGFSARTEVKPELEIWAGLSSGTHHVCLEVWPLRNGVGARTNLTTGNVESVGSTGAGRNGWYVPSYVVAATPEITTATVPGLMGPLLTRATIGQLLVGPPDWLTPTPARMAQLGVGALPVQRQGSEKALMDQLRQAYEARQPFMVSLWQPHQAHSLFELEAVGLPAAAGCSAEADTFGCDYPAEPLLKAVWPGLKFANVQLYAFLKAFAPPPDDIVNLLASSQDAPEVLARRWIGSRKVVWTPWIAAGKAGKIA